jgi:hypothetical protein
MTDSIHSLAAAVDNATLPKADWTHEAHITYATWAVMSFGTAAALSRIRSAIIRLNESHGVANTASNGYHETITRFYVARIAELTRRDGDLPLRAAVTRCVEALSDRSAPLAHWSRNRLFSPEARAQWVPPDLAPLMNDAAALSAPGAAE